MDNLVIAQLLSGYLEDFSRILAGKEEFAAVCHDFKVTADRSAVHIGPQVLDIAPRYLNVAFNVGVWVKFDGGIANEKLADLAADVEVRDPRCGQEDGFIERLCHNQPF